MRNDLDFSSWRAVASTLLGIVVVSIVAIGIRLLLMHGVQLRRERQNRQINERLKTLIAAYKTLGGSFTGNLAVDPRHLRELRRDAASADDLGPDGDGPRHDSPGAERRRRTRDAVEAALSDVILLGTEAQVRLAARAADDMVGGRPVETAELVACLRDFIRDVLDLEIIPSEVAIPPQGPSRTGGGGRGGSAEKRDGGGKGRGDGAGAAGMGMGMGMGVGAGGGRHHEAPESEPLSHGQADTPVLGTIPPAG